MKTQKLLVILTSALLALFLAACAAGGTPVSPDQLPGAVLEAQNWLAEQLDVAVEQVEVVSFDQMEWTDSCLGLGGPAESCLQAITPGYQVTFRAGGQEYEVRTDETGAAIRSPQVAGMPE
jgi:hypothetical protein